MNIFVLDNDVRKSVEYYVDSHVVKMQVETAQLLSTASYLGNPSLQSDWKWYKPTHVNHPCNIWARTSKENYDYLKNLMIVLQEEWNWRWDHSKSHASYQALLDMPCPMSFPSTGLTPFAICTTGSPAKSDAIESYRHYYAVHKTHIHKWKRRDIPYWIQNYS